MFPSVRLAQNILETGGVIHPWNNLGGIKVGSGKPNAYWRGGVVNKGTWEVYSGKRVDITAAFRAYETLYDFYKDQDLLFKLTRYTRVCEAKTPNEQAHALLACGYATDPKYAEKLITIMVAYGLYKYDEPNISEKEEDELKLTDAEWNMLVNAIKKQVAAGVLEKKWIEKVEKRDITLSQLTWLNAITLSRK